jgi:hypothetical protein
MSDFILKERDYNSIVDFLTAHVLGFSESEEFIQLRQSRSDRLPHLVCGAFNRYFLRLLDAERRIITADEMSHVALSCFETIEQMAQSNDPEVRNMLVVEVFDHLDCDEQILATIRRHLRPASKLLYEHWVDERAH